MFKQIQESMLHQQCMCPLPAIQKKIQSFDWPKWCSVLWHYVIFHFFLDQTSFQKVRQTDCPYINYILWQHSGYLERRFCWPRGWAPGGSRDRPACGAGRESWRTDRGAPSLYTLQYSRDLPSLHNVEQTWQNIWYKVFS